MRTTKVTVGGAEVEIPNHEIPELIATLTAKYQSLLISGAISAKPAEGFVSYEEAEQVLSAYYSNKMLRYHAGRLWGAICRMTRHKELHFGTKCVRCGNSIEYPEPYNRGGCSHGIGTAVGYREILISRASILDNSQEMQLSTMRTIGPAVKIDYLRIVQSLASTP